MEATFSRVCADCLGVLQERAGDSLWCPRCAAWAGWFRVRNDQTGAVSEPWELNEPGYDVVEQDGGFQVAERVKRSQPRQGAFAFLVGDD